MIPVAKLKHNLEFNKNLGELIEIMKLAALLRFNQFRAQQEPFADFLLSLEGVFNFFSGQSRRNIFLDQVPDLPAAIILISSDEGFLGDLNTLLVNKLTQVKKSEDEIIVLGQQGADYLEELNFKFIAFASPSEKLEFSEVLPLREHIFTRYRERKIGRVEIIYSRFVNITSQQIESEALLPVPLSFSGRSPYSEFIIEPDFGLVFEGWVKLWLGFRLYQIYALSKLAEFAGRIMHLEASTQELTRIGQHLNLEYFKYRHSLSDKAIREISASRLLRRY